MKRLVLTGVSTLIAAPVSADSAKDMAFCAGVTDATFEFDRKAGDAEFLDEFADQAHIFMTLARRERDRPTSAVLHEERRKGREALSRPDLSDDDAHTLVQACSDLHQKLIRDGKWVEEP